jgi:phosphoglycerate dehydrogenase-like enzyme
VIASARGSNLQMEKWKISCLEAWDEAVKRIVLSVAPPDLGNPLFRLDQAAATPHTGAVEVVSVADVSVQVFENFQRLSRGERLPAEDRAA